jgi:senataxin
MEQLTPAIRDLAIVDQIGEGQEPTDNSDLAALLLSYLEKFTDANSLTDELARDDLRMALRVARDCGLDDQQLQGFRTAVGSQTGIACVYGPPGSGKTRVIGAIAVTEALLSRKLGNRRPVLVCAPANSHIDNMMDVILANLPGGHGLEITRFKDGYPRDGSLEFADESAPLTAERNRNFKFYDTRLRKIKNWAFTRGTRAPHPMADTAAAYLELMRKVKAGHRDKVERERRRSDMEDLLQRLTQHYVANTVDILFCTNAFAAYKILRDFGRFRVILQDESLGAFLADDATPLAAFKETCELFVLVGSDKPHDNVSMTRSAAGDSELTEASLFEIFVRDRMNADSVVGLDVQYRMHPQLSKPINDIFYGGNMEDAPSCSAESEVYNTWEHYLQGLKPAWNGNRRLAIDVSGDSIESHRPNGGDPWANEAEAQLFCDLVKGALDTEVPANGVPLTCANFLGVVFYGAQGDLINEKMFKFGINKPDGRIIVENVPNVQGAEGDIVLLSFARNIPDMPLDIGIIGQKGGLKVALSRAKQSLVVIGNIRALTQEKINENKLIATKKDKMSHFGSYIQDILDKNDGISYGDVQRFLNGEDIMEAEFPKLLKDKVDATKSIKQDGTTAEVDEQDSGREDEVEKKARKVHRRQNPHSGNYQKKKNWFRDYRDRNGRGGRGGGAAGGSAVRT